MASFLERISVFLGAGIITASALIILCLLWWQVLVQVKKCALETYLLADLRKWAASAERRGVIKRKEQTND